MQHPPHQLHPPHDPNSQDPKTESLPQDLFRDYSDLKLFGPDGLLSSELAEASVAEVSGEVAALQSRLHCNEESGRIRTVDDAVIVRECEIDR